MHDREIFEPAIGSGAPLIFLHANSYAPGAYRRLLEPLAEHYTVFPMRLRPLWHAEPTRDWHVLVEDVNAALKRRFEEPVFAVGHSLGAVTSLLAAAKSPQSFASLALIEPGAPSAGLTWLLRRAPQWVHEGNPIRQAALRRRDRWATRDEALADERRRRLHARVSDEVLQDIVDAGLVEHPQGGVTLRFSKQWEATLYESPPNVWRALRESLPPLTLVRGADSKILSQNAYRRWQRCHPKTHGIEVAEGGHLLPLEHPEVTARIVLDALRSSR